MPSNSRYNKQTAQLATIKQLYIRLVAHTVCIKYMCVCVCVNKMNAFKIKRFFSNYYNSLILIKVCL